VRGVFFLVGFRNLSKIILRIMRVGAVVVDFLLIVASGGIFFIRNIVAGPGF